MKLKSIISFFTSEKQNRRNLISFLRLIGILILEVLVYGILFHFVMQFEGRTFTWITGIYWALTVMSTLGFGDITFRSDFGMLYSVFVLLSGLISIIIILPSAFLQFVYTPIVEAQKKKEIQRALPETTQNHVIIIGTDPICINLARVLMRYGYFCVILSSTITKAQELINQEIVAVMGDYDDKEVYEKLRADKARMIVSLEPDEKNVNIAFSIREYSEKVPLLVRAQRDESVDILKYAGVSWVFQFRKILGRSLIRRLSADTLFLSILLNYRELVIVESPLLFTKQLIGKNLIEANLRGTSGINVLGLWNSGNFIRANPKTIMHEDDTLVIAGTKDQIKNFALNEGKYAEVPRGGAVLVIGGGTVGKEAALGLKEKGLDVVIIDKENLAYEIPGIRFQVGNATDRITLDLAGIQSARAAVITTHDDDMNIYLTIYCRKIRNDLRIISRCTLDRNIHVLYMAGANLVLSMASLITDRIVNLLEPGRVFMLNENLNIFRTPAGTLLEGKNLITSGIRAKTACNVVAVKPENEKIIVNPDPKRVFKKTDELFLIGDSQSEKEYYKLYWPDRLKK